MVQATDKYRQSGLHKHSVSYIKIKVASNGIYVDKVEDWFSHCFFFRGQEMFFSLKLILPLTKF